MKTTSIHYGAQVVTISKKGKNVHKAKTQNVFWQTQGNPISKKRGTEKGVERAKQCLFEPTQSDIELAFALSVSEGLEKERQAELENSELAVALRVSMEERDEVGSGGVEVEM